MYFIDPHGETDPLHLTLYKRTLGAMGTTHRTEPRNQLQDFLLGALTRVLTLMYMSLTVGVSQSTQQKPTQTWGEHAN